MRIVVCMPRTARALIWLDKVELSTIAIPPPAAAVPTVKTYFLYIVCVAARTA